MCYLLSFFHLGGIVQVTDYMDVSNDAIIRTLQKVKEATQDEPVAVIYAAMFHMIYLILKGPDADMDEGNQFTKTMSEIAVMEAETGGVVH